MNTVTFIKVVCSHCGQPFMNHCVPVSGRYEPVGGCGQYNEVVVREVVHYPFNRKVTL